MITITLPDDIAHDVYDELYARMEQIDSFDATPERERISAALWTALQALETAGSGPAPLEPKQAACGHPFEHHSDELHGRWCSDCNAWCSPACYVGDPHAPNPNQSIVRD